MLIMLKLSTTMKTQFATEVVIDKLDQALATMTPRTPATDAAASRKPLPPSTRRFTGREEYLSKLKLYFEPQAEALVQRRHFLLYGMGGAGKTQICLRFAEMNADLFVFSNYSKARNLADLIK
jgi:Holliday junction resolvasome RuvABC ATP-dependent DNA helicase subunit